MHAEKEFEGNVKVVISDKEVRLWVCNKQGANIFRFKATGKVFLSGQDVTVMSHSLSLKNCNG